MTEVAVVDRIVDQNKVVELYLKGENPTAIARSTGLKRAYVLDLVDEYKNIARSDTATRDHAREMLAGLAQHYDMLKKKAYEVIEDVDAVGQGNEKMMAQKLSAIKIIAQLDKDRLDVYHRAGLMDDEEMGEQVAEAEAKMEAIKELMLNVSQNCTHCRVEIARGLGRIFNESPTIVEGTIV